MVNNDILQLLASEAGPTLKSIAEELLRRRHEADYPVHVEDESKAVDSDILALCAQQRDEWRAKYSAAIGREKEIEAGLLECRKAADDLRARAEIAEACAKEWEKTANEHVERLKHTQGRFYRLLGDLEVLKSDIVSADDRARQE